MKFSDALTSDMNAVIVRRKSWPAGQNIRVYVYDCNDDGGINGLYTFTSDDAQATDWVEVIPKEGT